MTQNIKPRPDVGLWHEEWLDNVDSQDHIALGRELASQGRTLVYGGGNRGVMGAVSATVLENGGRVHGVIPQSMLDKQGESQEGTGLFRKPLDTGDRWKEVVVDSMHAEGGFIALPGGFGTFEEVRPILYRHIETGLRHSE
jgi:predicted Rossmann-fold nucleotide-binding protein